MNTASVEAGLGVDGEHHTGGADVGAHHPLHPGRQRDRLVVEAVVHAVGDRPVVVERGEHLPDREQDVVDAADVEEGLLLPGEGGVGQVLGGRAGAHRPGQPPRSPPTSCVVRRADVGLEVGRERLLHDRRRGSARRPRRARWTSSMSRPASVGDDRSRQALVGEEPAVGVGRRGEPVRAPAPRPWTGC